MKKGEVTACDLQIESYSDSSSVEGTITLQDGRYLTIDAQGSASDRGTYYTITEEGGEPESYWFTEVEWLDDWISGNWPTTELEEFRATVRFGPDLPWTETVEELPREDDD